MSRLFFTVVVACIAALVLVNPKDGANAQEQKAPDGDTTSLIPSSIKDYEIEIDFRGAKVPVRVQYALQGQTIFVLPVWVAAGVEKVVDGKVVPCKPDDRVLAADEKRSIELHVGAKNLLDIPDIEKVIEDKLRQLVIRQQGLDNVAKFRFERPTINSDGIRFTLIGPGRGDQTSPAQIAVANPVSQTDDGKLIFTLDHAAVRKIEADRRFPAGLTMAALTILPTGPMKVRFERLEMEAQVKYLRATLNDFRKRIGSAVSSEGTAPDVIVLPKAGDAESKNQLNSVLVQSLQVTVSTRQGVSELPLMRFLEASVQGLIKESSVDMQNDQQRITFLLENQVTVSATLGEIKRLSKLDEKGRTEAIQKASDHYYAHRRNEHSTYSGNVQVGFKLLGGSASGNYTNNTADLNEKQIKEGMKAQKEAFDKVLQQFEGKMPTLSGIKIQDDTLVTATKEAETRFQQKSFFVEDTLHRFPAVRLQGSLPADVSLSDLLRDFALLKAEHENLRKLVGTPAQLAEAKANMEKLAKLHEELKTKLAEAEKAYREQAKLNADQIVKLGDELQQRLAETDKALGKLDQAELAKLATQVAELKRRGNQRPLEGHTNFVRRVAFSADGKLVATASDDRTARIWSASTGKELNKFQGHSGAVCGVAFSPDSKWLITCSSDRTARIWNTTSGKETCVLKGHTDTVNNVAFSHDGKWVVTCGDKTARIWEGGTGKEVCKLEGHTQRVRCVAFSPNDEWVVTGSEDNTVRIWEAGTGKELRILEGHKKWVLGVAFSPDGEWIASGAAENTALIWNAKTGKEVTKLEGHKGVVLDVSFSGDGQLVVTGCSDGTARIWNSTTGTELRKLSGHPRPVSSVAFCPKGKRIVTGSSDGTALVWDIE